MVGLKLMQWGREMSNWAQVDTVEVADEWLGLKRHGGGRRQAIVLKLTWWEWDMGGQAQIDVVGEMSNWARVDMVEVADKWSGPKRCGGGRRQAFVLELTWWEWDMSSWAQIDMVEEGDEQSGLS